MNPSLCTAAVDQLRFHEQHLHHRTAERCHGYTVPTSSVLPTHLSTSGTHLRRASGASACGRAEWLVIQGGSRNARLSESRAARWVATCEGEADESEEWTGVVLDHSLDGARVRGFYHAYSKNQS